MTDRTRSQDRYFIVEGFTVFLPLIWAGAIVGVSLIATPAKFLAESLDVRTALDVGRATFELFSRIELFLAATMLAVSIYWANNAKVIMESAILTGIVSLQSYVLLPFLSNRAEAIIAGYGVEPSLVHEFYGLLELCKVAMLIAITVQWRRAESRGGPNSIHSILRSWTSRSHSPT